MARPIIKLAEDEYIEWTTVADAPCSYSMSRQEAVKTYGEERILRADAKGTSLIEAAETAEEFVAFNRAGENESCLTFEEIRNKYRK